MGDGLCHATLEGTSNKASTVYGILYGTTDDGVSWPASQNKRLTNLTDSTSRVVWGVHKDHPDALPSDIVLLFCNSIIVGIGN
jgi:hypothetical protein